jgi:hypothetical protein
MSETKGERRAQQQQKQRHGMKVTGKYFWRAIANSQAKRDQAREKKLPQHQENEGTNQPTA